MFRFENIEILYYLMVVPLMILMIIWLNSKSKRRIHLQIDSKLLSKISDERSKSKTRLKLYLKLAAISLCIIAYAGILSGAKLEQVKREGIDLLIALDVSNSMLAEDIKPNRLERSKLFISKLIEKSKGNRIGLIVFAGQAYTHLPITDDYSAARMYLSSINVDMVNKQGTDISSAIEQAENTFTDTLKKYQALVIITDGEDHDEVAINAAKDAVEKGMIIHTIGVGSEKAVPVPMYQNDKLMGFKSDRNGNTVMTQLNESILQEIAKVGNGIYGRLGSGDEALTDLIKELDAMESRTFDSQVYTSYENRFQYLVGLAFLLLILDLFITERKSLFWKRIDLFKEEDKR